MQRFNVGPSSCGAYGTTPGWPQALERFGTLPLGDLCARARARGARGRRGGADAGVPVHGARSRSSARRPRRRRSTRPTGELLQAGETMRFPELGDLLDRLGAEGPAFLYDGRRGRGRVSDWVLERGGLLTREDLAALRGGRARARARRLPRPRGAHQPAAVLRRDPDRRRARDPRAARATRTTRASIAEVIASHQPRARRGVPRGPGAPRATSSASCAKDALDNVAARGALAAGQHHAHLGARRRRATAPRSPARTARARAWSCPAPACTSTTCSARTTSTRSATTGTSRARACRA